MKPFRPPAAATSSPAWTRPRPASSGCCWTSWSSCWPPTPTTSAGDPVLARLLPDGHRGDPELAADYRELTEASLRSGKTDDLAIVRATLPDGGGEVRLDRDQAGAWLRSSNDLRLALGTRLDITEDTEPPDEIADEEDQQLAVYYWLTSLQGSLVDALAAGRGGRS